MMLYITKWTRLNMFQHPFAFGFMLAVAPTFSVQANLGWIGVAFECLTDPCSCPTCMVEREIERRVAAASLELNQFTSEKDIP